jgi:hypothetical protein
MEKIPGEQEVGDSRQLFGDTVGSVERGGRRTIKKKKRTRATAHQ